MNRKTKIIFICAVAAALVVGIIAGIAISKKTGNDTDKRGSLDG